MSLIWCFYVIENIFSNFHPRIRKKFLSIITRIFNILIFIEQLVIKFVKKYIEFKEILIIK